MTGGSIDAWMRAQSHSRKERKRCYVAEKNKNKSRKKVEERQEKKEEGQSYFQQQ
jgi:hypothetical protein